LQLVFADLNAHALCADPARATAYWGAGWAAVAICLSLLLDSLDIASLRRWAAVDVRIVGGLIRVTHRDAVVTLAPLTDDGSAVAPVEEIAMDQLDRIRHAQVIDIACNGKCAATRRAR
jgi:hypothetical protein